MAFIVNLEGEDGAVLESIGEVVIPSKLLPSIDEKDSSCLKYLDPYGDTVFNNRQMGDLITELRKIKREASLEVAVTIDKIIILAEKCKQGIHLYLKFYGD